jgi:hypothetical protein
MVDNGMKQKYRFTLGFLLVMILSIISLIYNIYYLYLAWPSDIDILGGISFFFDMWFWWMPSVTSFLCSAILFVVFYRWGDLRRMYADFVAEQGGKKIP